MEHAAILALMDLAVGAGRFAQPRPGAATPEDLLAIFRGTLPAVLL